MKKYKAGFYGGKFLPFHKGHRYCIEYAAEQCERLTVILFYSDETEMELLKSDISCGKALLAPVHRKKVMKEFCDSFENVDFAVLDCQRMLSESEADDFRNWDYQTSYVLNITGSFDAVYSSEPGYSEYFKRAYPWATHELIDVPREHVHISGTEIRQMNDDEASRWL